MIQDGVTCAARSGASRADFDAKLGKLEAALAELGETLKNVYDES
jgi:hypothetical protein